MPTVGSSEIFCASVPDVDPVFARSFYRMFLDVTGVKATALVVEASLCRDLGICEEDADDCFAELCKGLGRRVPTRSETAAANPVVTVGQLLRYIHSLEPETKRASDA